MLILLSSGRVHSQNPSYRLYDENNGLQRAYINDIYRDKEGFYWLATEKGLVRFDGLNFVGLSEGADDPAAISVELFHPFRDRLYFTGVDRDAFYLDLNDYSIVRFYQGPIADVYPLGPDRYCILTDRGLLKFFKGDKLLKVMDFNTDHPGRLAIFNQRIIVAAPKIGMFALDADLMEVTDTADVIPAAFNSRFSTSGRDLFFTSVHETYRFESLRKMNRVEPVPGTYTHMSYFNQVSPGSFYYITQGKSLYKQEDGQIKRFTLDLLQNFELRCVFEDPAGDVLLGTNQGLVHFPTEFKGLSRIDDNTIDANGPLRVRRKVLQGPDSSVVLFGTEFNYLSDRKSTLKKLSDIKLSTYDAIRIGRYYYISTEGQGLARAGIEDGKVDRLAVDGMVEGKCYGLFYDSTSSRLLVGTLGRVIVLELGSGKSYSLPVGDEPVAVKSILRDHRSGTFWIAAESGLYKSDQALLGVAMVKNKDGAFFSVRCDELLIPKNGKELWVSTTSGVTVFDLKSGSPLYELPKTIFSNPRVVSLEEGPRGRIWMGTYAGIVAYDPTTRDFIRLEKKNGLMNQEFNYKSSAVLDDGHLVFGGLNGYDVIDPFKIDFSVSPKKGYVTGYHIFSKSDTSFFKGSPKEDGVIRYNLENQHLRLYLSSGDLSNASRFIFEYAIDGSAWVRLGGNAFIDLFWLEDGRHLLKCRAFNLFGTIIEYQPVTIIAQIPFYVSSWFLWTLTGFAFLFLVLLIMAINYRRRSENALKEKISMDLHDEVGTMLTRTLYQSREIQDAALRHRVTSSLNAALFSLRVFIHTISKRVLFLQNLMDEVADLLTKTFAWDDFQFDWSFKADRNYVVSPELYRDVKLVMFELVNNVVKHADASNLKVVTEATAGNLQINVEDNGPATEVPEEGSQGHGLRNIRRRIERHKGIADIRINPSGHGFSILINIPL